LIGLGGISKAHAEGYRRSADRCKVTAVCDVNHDLAAQRASEYDDARPFSDATDLIRSGLVDAVDIMLPHSIHEAIASEAISNGVSVLVEKPATPTAEAYDRLLKLAAHRGVMLAVAENTRYVDAYTAARDLVDRGDLGEVQYVRTLIIGDETERLRQRDLWKGRRDGTVGGVILDAGAHSFFLLSWFFGAVRQLEARGWQRVAESEVEDVAVVTGELTTGAQFVTEYSFTAAIPWSERAEIYGSKGSLIIDQLADPVVKAYRHKRDYDGAALENVPYNPSGWKFESIAAEVADFVEALADGRATKVNSTDVRNALVAIDGAYRSISECSRVSLAGA
jgi:predicted dehydrogenase